MAMNSTLIKAILSMDSYNRGYGAGINLTSDALGSVKIAKTIIDGIQVNLDSSAIFRDPLTKLSLDDDIGFYSIAYQLASGEKVISYRGTDAIALDALTGFPVGSGNPRASQAIMAFDFYNAVAGGADPRTANISLTEHSLGGGLAGLVATNNNYKIERISA